MNPIPAIKLIVRELAAAVRRQRRASGAAALCFVLGLGLSGSFPLGAQEPDAAAQTNDVVAAEVLARISELVQAVEFGQDEDLAVPDEPTPANGLPSVADSAQPGTQLGQSEHSASTNPPGRSQTADRRSRGRRSYPSKSDPARSSSLAGDYSRNGDRTQPNVSAGTSADPAGLDYSAFRIIADRNIFDPNRYPRRPGETRARTAPRTTDSLTLVGTMSYERGEFAFFDGSSSDYRKALKLTDVIAGYKVCNITPGAVQLAAGTNVLELPVGMQLRREEDGPWQLAGRSGSPAAAPASTSTNAAAATTASGTNAASGSAEAESDIIKRLMQRREQE